MGQGGAGEFLQSHRLAEQIALDQIETHFVGGAVREPLESWRNRTTRGRPWTAMPDGACVIPCDGVNAGAFE
jgi:hypothetical protein